MKLYMIPECPFVHRVLLACDVRRISESQLDKCRINLAQPPAEMLAINPSGSVPTLQFDDGRGFHESLVIMEYLDTLSAPGAKIYGDNPRSIAETKVIWEAASSKLLGPAQQALYSFGNINLIKQVASQLDAGWVWLDHTLQTRGGPFFGGTELNFIDISLAPFLIRLPFASEIFPQIKLPSAESHSGKYLQSLIARCEKSGVFPAHATLREVTEKFSRPHALFLNVQNAPRTLIEDPKSALIASGGQLSAWKVERDQHGFCLQATFQFKDHGDAVNKMKWLHDAQEICDHHTSFTLRDFASVDILLVTHEPRWGVTEKDLTMAKLLQEYFLKGHLPS
ncbi:MAG: hypothetical protein RLZZ488_2771 [Pseudomonadota bacterium]|jgi:glutathione S-transferase/pterin-4a-carbinolamine dehydratase